MLLSGFTSLRSAVKRDLRWWRWIHLIRIDGRKRGSFLVASFGAGVGMMWEWTMEGKECLLSFGGREVLRVSYVTLEME